MSRFRHCCFASFSALLFLISMSTYAETETTVTTTTSNLPDSPPPAVTNTPVVVSNPGSSSTTVITTPAPAAKETIVIPAGYTKCTTVKGRWQGSTWISEHQTCKYKKAKTWVDSYWACNKHTQGECTNWVWKPGHWKK